MTEQLPKGGEALLIALATPGLRGTAGIPVLLWGRPGVGKSSFLEGLGRPGFPVLTLIASIHDPTDFSGLPVLENGKVRYAVPEWLDTFGSEGEGILFLDELTTAPPSVQAALLRVVLERKVGFHTLPPGVRIVAAANPPDLMSGGWELSPPLRNRFVHLQWDLPASLYKQALLSGYAPAGLPVIPAEEHALQLKQYQGLIHAFLTANANGLHSSPDSDRYGFASPRSWDFAAALMASCAVLGVTPFDRDQRSAAFLELLSGCVGDGIAANFVGMLRNMRLPDPLEVLEGRVQLDLAALDESELFVLFNGFRPLFGAGLPDENLLRRGMVLLQLSREAAQLSRRDVIFPALRHLAKQEALLPRMIRAAQQDAAAREHIMQFIRDFLSGEEFETYIKLLG